MLVRCSVKQIEFLSKKRLFLWKLSIFAANNHQNIINMKQYISLLLGILLVPAFLFAQEDDYESRKKRNEEYKKKSE